jgi:hypothetical protein
MFGPLVIARSEFVIDGAAGDDELPSLWGLLKSAVCREPGDKKRRIAVNDSKRLYSPGSGAGRLERGVLAFCAAAGVEPGCTDDLLAAVAYDTASRSPDQLWYLTDDGGPALPTAIDAGQLAIARAQLRRAAERSGVRVLPPTAAVLFEDRFNAMVRATRSKARCAWSFIAGHLHAVWQQHGQNNPTIVIDRQGGRTRYLEPLALLFEHASVRVINETPILSSYEIHDGDRAMRVRCQTGSEEAHLPVALASMTAKYLRELLMMRFNAFWRTRRPDLKPTAGYVTDGRRFLEQIEPTIKAMGIDRAGLVRER